MRVLVIGSGGREHALAWACSRSPQVTQVYVANGNGGTQWERGSTRDLDYGAPCQNITVLPEDVGDLLKFAQENAIELTVVGPEVPLSLGIVDAFQAKRLKVFGPVQYSAQLEASKAFSKIFMLENNIPTANYFETSDLTQAIEYVHAQSKPQVVKADGLAAGKGVIVCDTPQEAHLAVQHILGDRWFGDAGAKVIIEDCLTGREISVLAFCDGKTAKVMPIARDHKRALDGDRGANTGGMGAFAPTDDISQELIDEVMARVIYPALNGMQKRDTPYVGVLYAGLMITPDGIKTLEFNCRFGDPETQVILPLLKTDIIDIFMACVNGTLDSLMIEWRDEVCATVVIASQGYPDNYPKGLMIHGLEETFDGIVFHAGTRQTETGIVTNGGRVLAVTSLASTLQEALDKIYQHIGHLQFDGMHYRKDIGKHYE
jgi:phosphoribosylamine---glycine ligase